MRIDNWPSLGLLRALLIMWSFDVLAGTVFFPEGTGPSFLTCLAVLTLFRIVLATVQKTA